MRYKTIAKYNNRETIKDGIHFDSAKEASRYIELKTLLNAGKISNLRLQRKFVLIPSQKDESGKVIERECSYYADFSYNDENGNNVVEDVKGYNDSSSSAYMIYTIKRKLMLYKYGIKIKEV